MVSIKSHAELEKMRRVGKLVANVLNHLSTLTKPGISVAELDREAEKVSLEAGATPAFKGYHGYRHALCASVNNEVVHGIPSPRVLKEGDIIGLDFGLVLDGFYGDSAVTLPVGKVSPEATHLMETTLASLYAAIAAATVGNSLRDLARRIEETVAPFGYGIVREFVGHGIGQRLHEEPQVANYVAGASNMKLRAGMTIAIEPMVNVGTHSVKVLPDRWTAVTTDGSLSAHFEHTIAITDGKPEILTYWGDSPFNGIYNSIFSSYA